MRELARYTWWVYYDMMNKLLDFCLRNAGTFSLARSRSKETVSTWSRNSRARKWSSSQGQDSKSTVSNNDVRTSNGEATSSEEMCSTSDVEETKDTELKELQVTLEKKDTELKELQDKYLRALAESENIRQRIPKQVQDAKLFGIQSFAKDLIVVADILESANNSISQEVMQGPSKPLVEGLKLAEAELQKVFKANGLAKIDGKGEKFDPFLHESLFEVPGNEPGSVAVVTRCGYKLHDRTLRPARVGIVAAKTS